MSRARRTIAESALRDRVALVTGGGAGIGAAAARALAGAAAAIALVDTDEAAGTAVVRSITGAGGRALFVAGDVSVGDDCRRAVERTVDAFGGLDILVNNAGIIRRASVTELDEADWDRMMAVNVKSVFLMSRHAIPVIAKGGGGSIINIASGWGLTGGARAAAYCASKGAVVNLTRAMALDHGPANIRVNCICPGDTDTDMLRAEAEQLGVPIDEFRAQAARRPLGRVIRPDDVAEAALYLASDASAAVTGVALAVDGGGLAGIG